MVSQPPPEIDRTRDSMLHQLATTLGILLFAAASHASAASVEFDLAFSGGLQPSEAQRWARLFGDLGVYQVRVRDARAGDKPEIETRGQTYVVTGILSGGGQLTLPGGRFGISDRTKIGEWIENLKTRGTDAIQRPGAPRLPYGLNLQELAQVRSDLRPAVDFSTLKLSRRAVLSGILRQLAFKTSVAADIVASVRDDDLVIAELQGMSRGTALAYLLRPAGLAWEIRRGTRTAPLQYVILRGSQSEEPWPIGREPVATLKETCPVLLELVESEVADRPASVAIAAIEERLQVPFLYDRNSLLRHRIDLETQVNVPRRKSSYARLLGSVLSQAKARYELRVDEAGQPFLWITSIRR